MRTGTEIAMSLAPTIGEVIDSLKRELAAAQRNGNLAVKELNARLAAKDAVIKELKEKLHGLWRGPNGNS